LKEGAVMYCTSPLTIHTGQTGYKVSTVGNIKRSAVRLIALTMCALFIAATILSSSYILIHRNHKHDHNGPSESCTICTHIMDAENLLKQISMAMAGTAIIFFALLASLSILKPAFLKIGFSTPVKLKVRLNN